MVNSEIIKLLFASKKININQNRINKALEWAIRNGIVDSTKVLIEYGADVNRRWIDADNHVSGPLIVAARERHLEVVKLLLSYKINEEQKHFALRAAPAASYTEIVNLLKPAGAKE